MGELTSMNANRLTSTLKIYTNAEVNQMAKVEIVGVLGSLNLSTWGKREVVSKRLKDFCKSRRNLEANRQMSKPKQRRCDRYYDYLCVLDFECTCLETREMDYPHEIIEFPCVLLSTTTLEVIDSFHAYCKPVINPVLTKFCSELTGIKQAQVDSAAPFAEVLDDFQDWLDGHRLGSELRYAIAADGPWDMAHFFQIQCQQSGIPIPHHFRHWINVRKHFVNFYRRNDPSYKGLNLTTMLQSIGEEFDGRQHCGFDDARNIAKIVVHLLKDGCDLRINERLVRRDIFLHRSLDAKEISQGVSSVRTDDVEEKELYRPGVLAASVRSLMDRLFISQLSKDPKKVAAVATTVPPSFNAWKQNLPYRLVGITKPEFHRNMHLECHTCSENESDEEEDRKQEECSSEYSCD